MPRKEAKRGAVGQNDQFDPASGQLKLLIEDNKEPHVVEDIEKVDEEIRDKLVTVRHGYGVHLMADKVAKYAGQWYFGSRHGDGLIVASDGSEYRGNNSFGTFHGYGQFSWPKSSPTPDYPSNQLGHTYAGEWSLGKMHGTGQFHHVEGHVLKSKFCNNLYNLKDDLFVSPFDTQTQMKTFLNKIEERKADE